MPDSTVSLLGGLGSPNTAKKYFGDDILVTSNSHFHGKKKLGQRHVVSVTCGSYFVTSEKLILFTGH